ncbi:MAG: hypothetical protein K2Q03_01790 [Sphingobacteriaceae bacterium]|nr:hypothetical protein [Sphingobacteriaceae bacterium]
MSESFNWQQDFCTSIENLGINYALKKQNECLIVCTEFVNVVLLDLDLEKLNFRFEENTLQTVYLWQDIWHSRKEQVLSRMQSFAGLNKKIHGRKTKLQLINQKQAADFLNKNHLQSNARAKYKCGLMLDNELIAVATFNMRPMNIREGYQSAELIRFANKNGCSVVGGFSKLLQFFIKTYQPNDVMSYVDNDWSRGNSYLKIGFKHVSDKDAAELWVDTISNERYFLHRIPKAIKQQFEGQDELNFEDFLIQNHFKKVFNTGSSKYILYL